MNELQVKFNEMFTYGLEIENSCRQTPLARLIARETNARLEEVSVHSGSAYKVIGGALDGFLIEHDGSVNGCEVVTPILRYDGMKEKMELLTSLIHRLSSDGVGRDCGFHIHMGRTSGYGVTTMNSFSGWDVRTLKNLCNMVYLRWELFAHACNVLRSRYDWCQRYPKSLIDDINSHNYNIEDFARAYYRNLDGGRGSYYSGSRYYMLNLHSLFATCDNCSKTIEYRMFNGTANADKIMSYVDFVSGITKMAIEQNRISYTEIQNENERYAMRTFINKCGLIGDEFKTTRKYLRQAVSGTSNHR